MPQFEYTAKKGSEEAQQGVLDAENRNAALARLRDMGYTPIHLEEKDTQGAIAKRGFQKKKIGLRERNIFFRQLANLIESGMMLSRALRTLADQTEHPGLQKMIQELQEAVRQGQPFAEALEEHPKVFSTVIVSMIRAGETGGMLDEVLWRIVEFGEQEEELRGKVLTALVYPIFLLCVGGTSIFILVSFVFPKFIAVFDSFNAELPWMTKFVMAGCGFMGDWWWAILLAGGALVATARGYVQTDAGRHQWHALLLRLPILRTVLMKMYMAAFARTFGALVDNGVNVLAALRTTADTVNNVHIYEAVQQAHDSVKDGASLSEALGQSKRFPADVVNLFAVGEESGRVGAMAKRLSHMYDIEVDRAVHAAMSLFEPMLIVLMGVIIGFLVIAMLMPMLTLSSAIGV